MSTAQLHSSYLLWNIKSQLIVTWTKKKICINNIRRSALFKCLLSSMLASVNLMWCTCRYLCIYLKHFLNLSCPHSNWLLLFIEKFWNGTLCKQSMKTNRNTTKSCTRHGRWVTREVSSHWTETIFCTHFSYADKFFSVLIIPSKTVGICLLFFLEIFSLTQLKTNEKKIITFKIVEMCK